MDEQSDAVMQPDLSSGQRKLIIAAFIASIIRLILRSVFVIVSETPTGIPLIVFALFAIVCLIQLRLKGGCIPTFFYLLVEPLASTIYWCMMLFFVNTNESCSKLGNDVCEDITGRQLPADFIRRPYAWWVVLLLPGLLLDVIFLISFGKPVQLKRKTPEIEIRSMDKTVIGKKSGGIGGVGQDNFEPMSDRGSSRESQRQHRASITGLNRPVSPGTRPTNNH